MIKVYFGTNVTRNDVTVDESRTLRSVLEEQKFDYARGTMHLDGAALKPGDLDKPFSEFGIKEMCYLLNVAKADNG